MTQVSAEQPRSSGMQHALREATLGEYEILAELGRGGMATVFLAHDIALDRKVAVKVMAPHLLAGEGMIERFRQEARTAAQLSHPHIIPIYAVRETEAVVFFVMKFIEGRPLDAIIKKMGPLPIPMVKDVLTKVGEALGYAHRRDVVHRDVKPGNIMVDEEGAPIVTDFGIAKLTQAEGLTVTGTTIGTPAYMSPEQCDAATVTGASDQYSLGIVAFEMLTGQVPFSAASAMKVMYKQLNEALPPLEDFRPDCPEDLRNVVTRMLKKDPADRWPSMEAAVQKMGAHSTLAFDDPVRTQIIEVIKEGEHRQVLARIRTPHSPIPIGKRATSAGEEPAPPTKRAGLWVAAAVVALAAGGLLWVRPWESGVDTGSVSGSPAGAAAGAVVVGRGGSAPPEEVPVEESSLPAVEEPTREDPVVVEQAPADVTSAPAVAAAPSGPALAPVASVLLTGVPANLAPGQTADLAALALDAGGFALSGHTVNWILSNPSAVTVTSSGAVRGVAPGSATITASVAGATAFAEILVTEPPVLAIVMGPPPSPLDPGQTATLTAQPRGNGGAALAGREVTWASSDSAVAEVGPEGVVRAIGPGSAVIVASVEGVSGSVQVTVNPPRVDPRVAAEDLIARYARALESRDIAMVRQAFPGMTAEQERAFRQFLDSLSDLRADLLVTAFDQIGDRATANVSGTDTVFNTSSRREEQAPVSFRATFERGVDGWRFIQQTQ